MLKNVSYLVHSAETRVECLLFARISFVFYTNEKFHSFHSVGASETNIIIYFSAVFLLFHITLVLFIKKSNEFSSIHKTIH